MGSLAAQFLLESLLAPGLFAALVLILATRFGHERIHGPAAVIALLAAVGVTYVLAFGWPLNPALGARTKIMLAAVIGASAGLVLERHPRRLTVMAILGAVAIAVWIGFPALQHGRPVSLLLLLPVGFAVLALKLSERSGPVNRPPPFLSMIAIAVGLAAIAAFAQTFSLAQISLALASALMVISLFARTRSTIPVTLAAGAMLIALASALLLYSKASIPALVVLGTTLAAGRLAHLSGRPDESHALSLRHVAFCLGPAVLAIVVARIDAGPISLY